jgi:hypothetical protein
MNKVKIQPYAFATDAQIRASASAAFARGEKLILEPAAPHDVNTLDNLLTANKLGPVIELGRIVPGRFTQTDPTAEWVGAGVGGTLGYTAGLLTDRLTETHPAAGIACKIALAIIGAAAGKEIAKQATAVDFAIDPVTGKLEVKR